MEADFVATEEPRVDFGRVTPRGLVAAAGEFWLAGACVIAGWRLWQGSAATDLFGMEATLAYEFLGLMLLRFFLLGRDARELLADRRVGPLEACGKLLFCLFSGIALWLQLVLAVIVLPFLCVIEPWVGFTAVFLLARRVWWGYSHRPTNDRQAAACRAYWRLTRRIQWCAFGGAFAASLVLRLTTGALADEAAARAIQISGAGLYFLILGIFHLLRDPRLEEFEEAVEEANSTLADPWSEPEVSNSPRRSRPPAAAHR